MELLGYFSLGVMGLSLGLMGAGGAILTIPIMIYLFHIPVVLSTAYSLIIVGTTASLAAFRHREQIVIKKSLLFGLPSLTGVVLSRLFILPALPESFGWINLDQLLILLLISLMIMASLVMIFGIEYTNKSSPRSRSLQVMGLGCFLGLILGLLGAGGGFLIIPVLVVFLNLSMKEAIPTSLFITSLNSLMGFSVDQHQFSVSIWQDILIFICVALAGMSIGVYLSQKIDSANLKKTFGWVVLTLAIFITLKEFIHIP